MNLLSNDAWHIAVLIPARNEEVLLERCLRSVLAAKRRLPPNVSFDLVVVADSSMDDTYHIASALIRQVGIVIERMRPAWEPRALSLLKQPSAVPLSQQSAAG